jgi:predicted nucleotidyltransferase
MPSIRRVLLFGSLPGGRATPRSDADVLVVVSDSAYSDARERIPDVLHAMAPLPCPVDLFVLTTTELARAQEEDSPLARAALATGVDLL